MNKKLLISAAALIVSTSTFAGGILTNTNQNASYLRNPARDAVIAIDGVYSNPAGIAFLPEGFHFSLSWQAAWQKRELNATNKLFMMNSNTPSANRQFMGEATAPVIPSFQAAYVFNDKWSVSAQFAIGGGGGKCEFKNGLPMFEELIGGKLYGAQATSYSLNQNLTGEQYFYGIQVGGTYKVTDKVSVFGGLRGVIANCSYVGQISNMKANDVNASTYLTGVSNGAKDKAAYYTEQAQLATAAGMTEQAAQATHAAQQYTAAAEEATKGAQLMGAPLVLDCSQNGFGLTPIIGVDVNLGNLNLAAKYEFRTKIALENESNNSDNLAALATQVPAVAVYANKAEVRSDIPALLTLGAQYSFPSVRIGAGFHYYWDKDARAGLPKENKYAINYGDNTWEALLGVEWDTTDKLTLSCGGYRTQYGFDDADMTDTGFNVSSYGLCLGGAYKINDMLKINAGYMHSFYDDHKFTNDKGTACNYTRKNDVVGVSLDFKF